MFIQLSQMLQQANLSGVHLMIRPLSQGKISIAMSTESTNWQSENPHLKAALAQTLVIESSALDMQDELSTALDEISDAYVNAHTVSNAKTIKGNVERATIDASPSTDANNESDDDAVSNSDSENDQIADDMTIGKAADDSDLF